MASQARFLLGGCLLLGLAVWPLSGADPQPDEIEKLIKQLGDDAFAKRQEASRKLAEVGDPALPALRKAAQEDDDAEVRQRAEDLIKQIKREHRSELMKFGNGSAYWLNRVAFTPDGKQAIVTGGAVIVYDLENGNEIHRYLELNFARCGLALSRDGKQFVTGHQYDKIVRIGAVETGKEIRTFEGHTEGVWATALSPDGSRVASGGTDKTLRLWEVKTGKEIRQFPGIEDRIRSIAFSPDGRRLASGHWGENSTFLVRLWDVEAGKEIRSFKGHKRDVNTVLFLPGGQALLSAGLDGNVIVWDVATGKERKRMQHEGGAYGAAIAPDGQRALTAGFGDKTVRLWNLTTGKEVRTFEGHEGAVLAVAFSPDGKQALSSDSRCTLRLWRLP